MSPNRLRQHVAAGIVAGSLVGFADGVISLVALAPSWSAAFAAPVLASAMMTLPGALAGLTGYAVERAVLPAGFTAWLRADTARAGRLSEWALAFALAFVPWAAFGAHGAARYVAFALALQDEVFAAEFTMLAWAVLLCVLLLGTVVFALALHAAWSLAQGRKALVTHVASAALCAIALGLTAVCLRLARTHAALLGPALVAPYACASWLVLALAWTPWCRPLVQRVQGARGFWLAVAALLVASAPLASASRETRAALLASPGPAAVADLLARATDVDRDGQSSLFGGRDCAPFDARRGPLAIDIPDNGVDEDCDGRDGRGALRPGQVLASVPLPPDRVKPYDVVLIVVDAFRADRFGRPRSSLTPSLDALARESVVFEQAFSQSPSTRISFPSFLSGLPPSEIAWARRNGIVQGDGHAPLLAERLHRLGYRTGFVVNHWIHARLGDLFRGYDSLLDVRRVDGVAISPDLSAPSSTARAVEFIERGASDRARARPFFLTLYYDAPHVPYIDHRAIGLGARGRRAIDRYESEIRYVDREIGHFVDYLRVKPKLWRNTVLIVTSDHGEEFREHGGSYHDRTCYRESTHVPLVVRVPGLPPAVARSRVALVDLAPTVLALVGPAPDPTLPGRNLLFEDPARYAHVPDARVSCTYFPDERPASGLVQAVRDGRWLYVRDVARGTQEVYDTVADPEERRDLAGNPTALAVARRAEEFTRPPRIEEREADLTAARRPAPLPDTSATPSPR